MKLLNAFRYLPCMNLTDWEILQWLRSLRSLLDRHLTFKYSVGVLHSVSLTLNQSFLCRQFYCGVASTLCSVRFVPANDFCFAICMMYCSIAS